jgi:NitT/TauT family transport system substrate-binding protein
VFTSRKFTSKVLAAAALAIGAAGVGASAGATASGEDELTPITVGILPIADLAPLFYGIEEGYFAEEGLEVTLEVGQGGAALVPAVVTGEYQFAFGNYVSLMLARQNDVGVQIVVNVVDGAEREDRGTNGLLVDPERFAAIEDLAGATFAVTTLSNVAEVTIRTTLRNAGVDDADVEFVELPFPDMNAAVESGDVDVAWQAEPFVTLGEAAGLVNVADPMYGTMPSMPLAGLFASESWLADNPELADAFHRAMTRSLEASTDEEAMRAAIAANTQTPPEIVEQIALANWNPELDTEKLATVAGLAVEYGILDAEPDLDTLVRAAD